MTFAITAVSFSEAVAATAAAAATEEAATTAAIAAAEEVENLLREKRSE